ncbi:rhomboid family GlyGly-CTERM serine protease [Ereboglobus sp. PH5-10]|uniref:rhombosortase n=1 Tax=Ereboglobus sp. PH5-10 TaxID=2940629 RepID=UPI002404D412|nr:rhombosortase [Ereboglobus sp. PH5-10]MDF9828389.1 rhomboid family GlyGly-CTERM serine protease [Ereboglobus sp. PH5-10]
MKRLPFITLSLAVFALIVGALPSFTSAFEFTRESFARGEIWRVLTAHLTHFDAAHLRWDVFALLLLGSMAELKSRRDWLVALAVSAPLITLAVWILQPHFETYRGLSGLDCAAYGVVAGHLLRDGWRERHAPTLALGVLACGGALAKCGYELITGNPFFVGETDAFAPVPLAHLVGASIGVLTVFVRGFVSEMCTGCTNTSGGVAGSVSTGLAQ